ncbi:DNA polymerase III subunit beta [Candidatus Falkowbacteria bacterium]|nr:DNA polymerase III subunit beta [Candidatus Falkowbacteria bacterium]
MILSTLKENLKLGLSIVSHIAGKNVNLPILSNVMMSVKKEGVKLIATNLEIGITHKIRGKVEEQDDFTIDSKVFSDYINLLPNKKVNLKKEGDDLKIECENYKTKIHTQSSEDFPLIPKIEKVNKITTKTKDLKKALSRVVFAVSNNESRVELSGVFFNFTADKLILAATDSYRLAESQVAIKQEKPNDNEQKVIVPARTIQELIRIISGGIEEGGADQIDFYINESQILFIIDSTELISRLIEGQYPDYKQIIPQTGKTVSMVDKGDFSRAVKASSLFSKTGINDVNLDFPGGQNKVVVSSTSGNTGENITEIEADTKGMDNGIIVNYQYVLDGLNNMESDKIKIEVIDNNTPCVIKPEKGEGYLYIVMPIKQ